MRKIMIGLGLGILIAIIAIPAVRGETPTYYSNVTQYSKMGNCYYLPAWNDLSYFSDIEMAQNVNSLVIHLKGNFGNCTCGDARFILSFNAYYSNLTIILGISLLTESASYTDHIDNRSNGSLGIYKGYKIFTQSTFEIWIDVLSIVRNAVGSVGMINSTDIISLKTSKLSESDLEGITISPEMREAALNHYHLFDFYSPTGVLIAITEFDITATPKIDASLIITIIVASTSSVSLVGAWKYRKYRKGGP